MALTTFDKENLPEDLDTLKTLIEERESLIVSESTKKNEAIQAADAIISSANDELRILKVKAADILNIPSPLKPKEDVVQKVADRVDEPTKEEGGKIEKESAPAQ